MNTLKKTLLFFIVIIFSLQPLAAQVADSIYYERLYYTCKVWGHAKYYHSRIAAGVVNWDGMLLSALPGIKNAPDNQAFNVALLEMLQQAGETEAGTEPLPEVPDSLNNNTDLSWIYHPIFSEPVSALLDTIMQRFTPRPNVHVKPSAINHPNFSSDNSHYVGAYPDEYKRILAVFRYWNIIHYFFPYKYIMDQDWDTTLLQTIPEVVEAANAVEYHLAMREFTAKINDSHAFFNSRTFDIWKGSYNSPFLARFIEGEVVITKVHSSVSNQLYPGDVIKKIDGFDVTYLRDSLRKYSFGSNEISIETNLIKEILLWGSKGQFSLTVLNGTGEHTLTLYRDSYSLTVDDTPAWRTITVNGCRFGIVNVGNFTYNHFPEIIDKFHGVNAIIFDIRNYPNGALWALVYYYLFEAPIHIANFTQPDIEYPGRLFWFEEVIGQGNPDPLRKKVMILFDERTLSQAEYACMGLEQIPGAIKIGSTTAAADGNISQIHLPGEIITVATFLGTYYPDYTPTQRVGIIPDYEVRPTIQGIREGRDEVLEFALNCEFAGIEDIAKTEGIRAYPNPTTGELRIKNYELRIEEVQVFDVFGRKQKSEIVNRKSEIVINISHLPQGIYILKVVADGHTFTRKIVKTNQ